MTFQIKTNDKKKVCKNLRELEFLKEINIKLYSEVLELRCILAKHGLTNEVDEENSFIQKKFGGN